MSSRNSAVFLFTQPKLQEPSFITTPHSSPLTKTKPDNYEQEFQPNGLRRSHLNAQDINCQVRLTPLVLLPTNSILTSLQQAYHRRILRYNDQIRRKNLRCAQGHSVWPIPCSTWCIQTEYFQGKISRHGTMFSLFGSTLTSKPRSQTPVSLTSLKMTIPNSSRFRSMSCTTSTMKCRAQSKTSLTSCCFTRDFSSLPISTTTPYWVSCYLQDQACI